MLEYVSPSQAATLQENRSSSVCNLATTSTSTGSLPQIAIASVNSISKKSFNSSSVEPLLKDVIKQNISKDQIINLEDVEKYFNEHRPAAKCSSVALRHSIADTVEQLYAQIYPMHVRMVEQTFANSMTNVAFENNGSYIDPIVFLAACYSHFIKSIRDAFAAMEMLKNGNTLIAQFSKGSAECLEHTEIRFHTKSGVIDRSTELQQYYRDNVEQTLMSQLSEFQACGSGWTLTSVDKLLVAIDRYSPLRGGSLIPLPLYIAKKKSIVNVANSDEKCFQWAVLAGIYDVKNKNRVKNYKPFESSLNFSGIRFPVAESDFNKFERQNDVSINVFILNETFDEKFDVVPIYLTRSKKQKHVNLLRLKAEIIDQPDPEDSTRTYIDYKYHYCTIKSLPRLLSVQIDRTECKKYICERCLSYFHSETLFAAHENECKNMNPCRLSPPNNNNKLLRFTDDRYQILAPFVIYANVESLSSPTATPPDTNMSTHNRKHVVSSIGFYLKSRFDNVIRSTYTYNRGKSCLDWFCEQLSDLSEKLNRSVNTQLAPFQVLSSAELLDFNKATTCHICSGAIDWNYTIVKDYCHLTGKYRGAAHEMCNMLFVETRIVPVVFHNLGRDDAHAILAKLSAMQNDDTITGLSVNDDKYISFTVTIKNSSSLKKVKFRFIDSYMFLPSTLDQLVSYLPADRIRCLHAIGSKIGYTPEQLQLLLRKAAFPSEFIDSFDKYTNVTLPLPEEFHSSNAHGATAVSDYEHAEKVWSAFGIAHLGEYSDLYLLSSILLLADVFENFRKVCQEFYRIDPAHYITASAFSWNAMLKFSKVKIELLTDINMVLFVEKGRRGGVSQCSHHYSKANNQYMDTYDSSKPSNYLMQLDADNLYGRAMMECLPLDGYAWHPDTTLDVSAVADNSPVGYILEVDLHYPISLHDDHSDYPLCPVSSRESQHPDQNRLLLTLHDKKNYVLHYRALKQALSYGLKLTHVHRILRFNQSPWMEPYIRLNNKQCSGASNDFERFVFKQLNDSLHVKAMENIRHACDIKLRTKWEGKYGVKNLIANPHFKSRIIIGDNLVAVELFRSNVVANKPIAIAMSVLDIAQTLLYDFHYGFVKTTFADKAKLLYTDSGSLVYDIECEDFYQEMRVHANRFDTSDYPASNPYHIKRMKGQVFGHMRDRNSGRLMTEYVSLRSKMYSTRVVPRIKVEGSAEKVEGHITFEHYHECIRKKRNTTMQRPTEMLWSDDDKRSMKENPHSTLPWGHYTLEA